MLPATDYEYVAASATTQTIGEVGAIGNVLQRVIIIPTTVAAGVVSIKDGSDTAINIYDGGAVTALAGLQPIVVELGLASHTGVWAVTTGANVRAIAVGRFTSVIP